MTPETGPDKDCVDIGDDHQIKFFGWHPDRDLNPQWAHLPDIDRAGCLIWHKRPDNGEQCSGAVQFDTPTNRELWPAKACWQVESYEPLTISPSVLCLRCQDHGFIRAGRWVKA